MTWDFKSQQFEPIQLRSWPTSCPAKYPSSRAGPSVTAVTGSYATYSLTQRYRHQLCSRTWLPTS